MMTDPMDDPIVIPPADLPHGGIPLAVLPHAGVRYAVSLAVEYDGLEHLGTLWFGPEQGGSASRDHGTLPGRTPDDVHRLARTLSLDELHMRLQRALAEKRRFLQLRALTDELLGQIRYLNQVAVSMRNGLLDADGAADELRNTESSMRGLLERITTAAGVEGPGAG
jgi:hypothetical protein